MEERQRLEKKIQNLEDELVRYENSDLPLDKNLRMLIAVKKEMLKDYKEELTKL